MLNRDDVDAKADAFIDFLAERVVGREYQDDMLRGKPFQVQSFADLEEFFRAIFDFMEALGRGGEVWRTHHLATIRKVRNRLGNISHPLQGPGHRRRRRQRPALGRFEDRSVHVVDVAGLDPLAQDLVFARIVSKLREHLERRDLGVDHVVVFVDELNKYAPADGPDTYVRKMLLDLSERGRYLGLVLFSAQQFRSQVQRRVVGNAGTALYGRMDMDELATPGYATLSPATKIKLATLPKGELMLRHPHFTQPIFVRFPRPAVLSGREGIERFPPAAELPFRRRGRRGSSAGSTGASPRRRCATRWPGGARTDVRRALAATRRERPADPFAFFLRLSGQTGRRGGGDGAARYPRREARRRRLRGLRRVTQPIRVHPVGAHGSPLVQAMRISRLGAWADRASSSRSSWAVQQVAAGDDADHPSRRLRGSPPAAGRPRSAPCGRRPRAACCRRR